ncbi:MAG TPA: lysoplasmalogenase family protein [Phenylobacterium sp.]|nr:lysoplasmalogenase family protein [Phenylobacterium sp.]
MARRPDPAAWILYAAVFAGVSYVASWNLPLSQVASTAWKGAGVGLLALYAGWRARDADGWLLCAVLGLGALGDVLLETAGLTTGALAFLAGHLVAIALYLRNRRPALATSQALLAALIVPATVATAWLLPGDRTQAPGIALYALGLSAMAACAWISRFPRYRVGLGALMFVVSDLLIFARAGPLSETTWIGLAIWGLYFAGQLLICVGVTGTRGRAA